MVPTHSLRWSVEDVVDLYVDVAEDARNHGYHTKENEKDAENVVSFASFNGLRFGCSVLAVAVLLCR